MSAARVARVSLIGVLLSGLWLLSGAIGSTSKLAPLAISQTLRTAGDPGAIAVDASRSRAYVTDARRYTSAGAQLLLWHHATGGTPGLSTIQRLDGRLR